MLAECLLAAVLVLVPAVPGEPGPVVPTGDGAPAQAVSTETAVTLTPLDGGRVRLDVRVTGADGATPTGRVEVRGGDVPIAEVPLADGFATLTTGAHGDGGGVVATYLGDAAHLPSHSPPPPPPSAGDGTQGIAVTVTIPAGALTLGVVAGRADTVRVTDTRAGERGFVLSATIDPACAPSRRSLLPVVLRPVQVPGMAMQARDAVVTPLALLSGRPTTVLTYPAHAPLGALDLRWHALPFLRTSGCAVIWTVL